MSGGFESVWKFGTTAHAWARLTETFAERFSERRHPRLRRANSAECTLTRRLAVVACCDRLRSSGAMAQAEMNGWGNLRGIRVDGDSSEISTAIAIASPGWKQSGAKRALANAEIDLHARRRRDRVHRRDLDRPRTHARFEQIDQEQRTGAR